MKDESVLVTPGSLFREIGSFDGFEKDYQKYLDTLLMPKNLSFRPRDQVEEDPTWKQLIPYALLQYSRSPEPLVFQYCRGGEIDEARLRKKWSVGVGGHILPADGDLFNPDDLYLTGMRRELNEEIDTRTIISERIVGMCNSEDNPVGRVHLGIVHLCEVSEPRLVVKENDALKRGSFVTVPELHSEIDSFEDWSRFCIQGLF